MTKFKQSLSRNPPILFVVRSVEGVKIEPVSIVVSKNVYLLVRPS